MFNQGVIMPNVSWPDLSFGPVNLYSLSPAWFFYLTADEKRQLAYQVSQISEVLDLRTKRAMH